MRARGLVHPLFVAQTMRFAMHDVCSAKGEWVEHGIEAHEMRDSNNLQMRFRLGEEPIGENEVTFIKRWVPDKRCVGLS